jgi:hypothetical protein
MGRTVPRFHAVHLLLRLSYDSMRHLPLQTDGELQHQQRCTHPVCGVAHHLKRTPVAVMSQDNVGGSN